MSGYDDERTWRHVHDCRHCGTVITCYNPACTDGLFCPSCEQEKARLIATTLAEIQRMEAAIAKAQQDIVEAWRALAQLGVPQP